MKHHACSFFLGAAVLLGGCSSSDTLACVQMFVGGFRPIAIERDQRFLGKVQEATARCRGGDSAVASRMTPWVDWQHYWASADVMPPASRWIPRHLTAEGRSIDGALLDLEYQRIELIKFNLFDNSGSYADYVRGRNGVDGPAMKVWDSMRLPKDHPHYAAVGGDGVQLCRGELIRHRTLTGICNDVKNPAMGAVNQPFARNVPFDATFPELGKTDLVRNRHGDRLGLLHPDPQVISRVLLTRQQSRPELCREGRGLPGESIESSCDYQKAPFFNVLAAFWIQFMTHDWFSHLEEGQNASELMPVGCPPEQAPKLGCRPNDRIDRAVIAADGDPATFTHANRTHLTRAYKVTRNTNTAWWDASQLYGYDERSRVRVKRDPRDMARLLVGENGYLPPFASNDPIRPQWAGQEAAGFPDNWTIGMSFYHNVFAREHNLFVDAFRKEAAANPNADSGLRNPVRPDDVIAYKDVTADELFEAARLVVSAMIAKIHTTEWTPQLLYDEPLYLGMNANWHGLFHDRPEVKAALGKVVEKLGESTKAKAATQWYSVFASGPGIFGLGSHRYSDDAIFDKYDPMKTDRWSLNNLDHVNGGVNHFGSPFNFPEEFVTVYRLHALVPDLIEFRQWDKPNAITKKIAIVDTFRGRATEMMHGRGIASWAVSMGRQRLGTLTLQNSPLFLQNLELPRLTTPTGKIDVIALDIIRDRERGVPRFNEFRRQYGLKQLTKFEDFVDPRLPAGSKARAEQMRLVGLLREVYGQHVCDASKVITSAQRNDDGSPINDCLGHPNGTKVDNIEDVDTVIGWLSEFARPHGFAISETQFQVFILNASRRLFSDRFFTSSFRPEFYSTLGVRWVTNNGPDKQMERAPVNGHVVDVSPLKRVLQRTIPELSTELASVVNVFDPWARDRGSYYSLQWRPRPGAEADPAFADGPK